MEEKQTAFGQRLAGLRQARGLSQQALADRLAVTRQAVSNWERNQTIPDLDMLRAMAEALDVDMNTLCGPPEPKAPGQPSARSALSLALCGALCLSLGLGGGLWLARRSAPAATTEAAPAPAASQQERLRPHQISYTTPDGTTVRRPADGAQEVAALLEALPEGVPGPVELTFSLTDTFSYFAQQYELRFLPAFQDGAFQSDWEQVLLWLYRAGTSGGDYLTTQGVDASLAQFFGSVDYRHQGTEAFPLTDRGYYPGCGGFAEGSYRLTSLTRLADGSFEAVLAEDTEHWELTLVLSPQEGSLRFHEVQAAQRQ